MEGGSYRCQPCSLKCAECKIAKENAKITQQQKMCFVEMASGTTFLLVLWNRRLARGREVRRGVHISATAGARISRMQKASFVAAKRCFKAPVPIHAVRVLFSPAS
jgi:hypothetical protein